MTAPSTGPSADRLALLHRISAAIAIENAGLHQITELRREIDNPYVVGVPLTEQEDIFVGRTDISASIEQHLLDRRRPPLLLYGQRHIGKTSLLPSAIVPMFVDLQGPASPAVDHAGFLYNIARGMIDSADRQRGLALRCARAGGCAQPGDAGPSIPR